MMPLLEYPAFIYSYLLDIVFNEDATAKELFILAAAIGIFWHTFCEIVKPIVRYLTYDAPWLREASEREYERTKKMWEEWGIKKTKEEAVHEAMHNWPNMQVNNIQHLAGSMLCIPTLLGTSDPMWAVSLACCGGLNEAGFDMVHSVIMLCGRFFTKDGATKYPNLMLLFGLIHHSIAAVLVIPMVIYYRTLRPFHWLIFDLQFAGGLTILIEYSKLLDITKPGDLRQFKIINVIILVFFVWTRFLHWVYLSCLVVTTWYHDEAWAFLAVGGILVVLFSAFNAMACVIPFFKRWKKWRNKCVEYESLPADAPEAQRRNTMLDLQDSVNDLILEESLNERIITEDRIRLFIDALYERRDVERRHTMPPSRAKMAWGSTRLMRGLSVPPHMWSNKDD